MSADALRQSFLDFFAEKDHTVVPSASLIPHDPSVMFTVAGMVPFKPYFVGDESPPYLRAASSQKCARAGGKHNDLDDVGRTKRHLVFFEMLGNFSFGDYFKEEIIPWSWELVTERWGFDGDRLWITVHESDDEAEALWHEGVGVPMDRIQRLGDKDNFWQMGDTDRVDHVARFTSTEVRHLVPMVVRCMTLPVTASWSFGTLSSCSLISRPMGQEFCCRSHRLTPVQVSREFLRYCKVSTRCGKPISCSRCSTRHVR